MEKTGLKDKNRTYLKKVFSLKSVFYPFMAFLGKSGLADLLEPVINKTIKAFGINKNVHYFFKYRDYGKWFSGQFKQEKEFSGEILFPAMTGVHSNFTLLNLMLSKYFSESENLKPVFYICDSAFGICTKDGMLKSREKYPFFCHECWNGYKFIESESGIETIRMSSRLHGDMNAEKERIDKLTTLSQCIDYEYDGIRIGKLAKKSVLRYFLAGSLPETEEGLRIFRKFLLAASEYSKAFAGLLSERPGIRYVILNNGSLSFEAIARLHCEKRGIPYMTYETYIGNNSLIYKKNGAVMDLDWNAEYEAYKTRYIPDQQARDKATGFFDNLRKGTEMYAVLNREHSTDKLTGVKKYVCLFTNLNFDTAVIDKNYLFLNMEDWIFSVIDYWKTSTPGITLVIRVHPGELKLVTASREFLGDRIQKAIGNSGQIILFDSTEKVNSYELIRGMEYGLIYSSTIGLEIAWAGKPCIVAGLPWFRDKPFVIYPRSKDEYFNKLAQHNIGSAGFVPDKEELIRTINFVYFNRLKRFNGIKLYTPLEEPNSDFDNPGAMISENLSFFKDFKNELFGTAN